MRNGRYVRNERNFQTDVSECADSGLSALTGTLNENFDRAKSVFHSRFCSRFGGLLSRERSAFSRTFIAERARAALRNSVSVSVGYGNYGVIERGLYMHLSFLYVL